MRILQLAALVVAITVAPVAARAAIIFDNSSVASSGTANLPGGDALTAVITVSTPTAINQIGALINLFGDATGSGSIEFLIFDDATGTLLFNSGAEFFYDDGATFKLSDPFTPFTLLPGTIYDIGAIASVSGTYYDGTPSSDFTENGITAAHGNNGNAVDYNDPTLASQRGIVMAAIELGAAAQGVPEPETVVLLVIGLAASACARRRRALTRA